ncbi:MAG: ZIP family metal transporter [Bdellovibrionales bacterium]|nr:ZIP family metal transporter [Bdellovibrionales bacterium]
MIEYVYAFGTSLLLAFLTAWLGVAIVSKRPKWFNENRMNLAISLAAGFLVSLAFTEFLPHAVERNPINAGLYILTGITIIFIVEVYGTPYLSRIDKWAFRNDHPGFHDHYQEASNCGHDHSHENSNGHKHVHSSYVQTKHHHHQNHTHKSSELAPLQHTHVISPAAACSAVACLIVCTFFDGLEIAAAFRLGGETGWLTVVGLFFHVLPDGLIVASLGLSSRLSVSTTRFLTILVASSLVLGVIVAAITGSFVPREVVIGLSTGILIYVSFLHLIPVVAKTKRGVPTFLVSLILYSILISILHGHH